MRQVLDGPTQLRQVARWLELRAVGLMPEYFHPSDGARAAFITGVPLLLALMTGWKPLGWAIFAAFWTCLADTGGPEPTRRSFLVGFVAFGSLTTLAASSLAGLGPGEAVTAGPLLVFMTALLPIWWTQSSLVATLLGVVAVVAAGYPRTPADAAILALSFLCGSAWATLILTAVWRTDRWLPSRQAVSAVYARIDDMASDLVHRRVDGQHVGQSQHRRAVRTAIERAHASLSHVELDDPAMAVRLRLALLTADEIFHALLALDHLRIQLDEDTKSALEAIPLLLRASGRALSGEALAIAEVGRQADVLVRHMAGRPGADAAAIRAIAAVLSDPDSCTPPSWLPHSGALAASRRRIVQAATRSGTGVGIVTLVAHGLGLGYPYWAAMAVVVILFPVRQMSWSRAIERTFGSVIGGVLANILLTLVPAAWPLLGFIVAATAATIAVRLVNYTLFVVFLTLLFVLTMGILHPGDGIAFARMIDNILGSIVAITVTVLIWPEQRPAAAALAGAALAANQAYLDAVKAGDTALTAATRRAAGIASTEAEIAVHAPDWVLGAVPNQSDIADLVAARRLAGEAAALWYTLRQAP
ncbi:FUSC family protein [Methylobacterium sp. NPDC080182]|uniref:FUSC family protein n=1 Tax=Methylobacterium sp. NPDC080182 TaxID=3390590 RepID=UPI003CFE0CD3